MNIYLFIEAEKAGRRNVKRACALLKVSRAAFYQYLAGPSQREAGDAELTDQIGPCRGSRCCLVSGKFHHEQGKVVPGESDTNGLQPA